MITDSNKHQRAVDYVKNAVDRWRLETLQYRCRYSLKTGKLKKLPTQLRRFINSVPVDIVNDVLETLAASCPYKGTVFNLEDDEGLVYRPTRTMIRKDASLQSNTKDATYTIIQDLQLIDGTTDVFGYQDSSSCSQMSTAEYHWDESDVVDCPDGSQGVVYQIADISRDPNTDLFTYRIRKIQALTQHMGPYVARCSIDSVVTVETWDNVYGSEGAYTWDPVADHGNGAKIVLPVPCDHADGTSYEISVTENPDCTFKIAVQKTVAKTVPGMEYMRYRDQYQIKASDTDKNASAPLSKNGVEYSNGAMTEYQSRHNPDGSWDNVVAVNTERPVAKSTVEYMVGTRFTVSRWTDTNQGAAAAGLPTGAKFGSYKFTKTPGGLFTNEYASYTKADKQNLGLECLDTAFLHTHVAQATADFTSDYHVPAAKDGIVRRRTYNVDDYGICTQADETRAEHTVDSSQVSYTVTPLGVIAETRDRSESPEKMKAMEALIAAYSPANIGRSLSYSLTDGKLYDLSYRKITLNPSAFTQSQCSQTVFEHVDSETRAGGKLGNHVVAAGGGMFHRSETRLDDATGAVLTTDQKTVELPVSVAQRSVEVTNRATRVTVLDRNQKTTTSITTATKPGQADARTENDGASVNVQTTSVVPNVGALISSGCAITATKHQHFEERVVEEPGKFAQEAKDGVTHRVDVTVDDQGVNTRRDTTDTEIEQTYGSQTQENMFEGALVETVASNPVNLGAKDWVGESLTSPGDGGSITSSGSLSSRVLASSSAVPPSSVSRAVPAVRTVISVHSDMAAALGDSLDWTKIVSGGAFAQGVVNTTQSHLTDGLRYDTTKTVVKAKAQSWYEETGSSRYHSYTHNFHNFTENQLSALVDTVMAKAETYDIDGNHVTPEFRRTLNDFGLYDGSVGFTAILRIGGGGYSSTKKRKHDTKLDYAAKVLVEYDMVNVEYEFERDLPIDTPPTMARRIQTRTHIVRGDGVGSEFYQAFVSNKTFLDGSSVSQYDEDSQRFVFAIITSVTVSVDLVTSVVNGNNATIKDPFKDPMAAGN